MSLIPAQRFASAAKRIATSVVNARYAGIVTGNQDVKAFNARTARR